MQLEPPPHTHMDPCTHVDILERVFNARTDVFTFIPRYMHTHMPTHHSPRVHTLGIGCIYTTNTPHIHHKQNPSLSGLLSLLALARLQSCKLLEIEERGIN